MRQGRTKATGETFALRRAVRYWLDQAPCGLASRPRLNSGSFDPVERATRPFTRRPASNMVNVKGAEMEQRDGGRVVVGLSGSLAGYEALRYALERARVGGMRMIAVRTYKRSSRAAAQWNTAIKAEAAAEAMRIFDEAVGGVPKDVVLNVLVKAGPVGSALTETAQQRGDVLVIGASRRRFGGVVARHCGRRAACTVIIVPPPELAGVKATAREAHDIASEAEKYLTAATRGDSPT
jgi:nucleotide-binding universal stress UspA family protein